MKNMRIFGVAFLAMSLLAAPFFWTSGASAQVCCRTFGFPFVADDGNEVAFYQQQTGGLFRYDISSDAALPIGESRNLGGSIKKLSWSPDGSRILVLSGNLPAVKQELPFRTPDRDLDSLNWWLYELSTEKQTLLGAGVVDAGWLPDGRIVYNWKNETVSVSSESDLSRFANVATLPPGSDRKAEDGLSTVTSSSYAVMPVSSGIYVLGTDGASVRFFDAGSEVVDVFADVFDPTVFLVRTGSGLRLFDATAGRFRDVTTTVSVRDVAFIGRSVLAVLASDGRVHSISIDSGKEGVILSPADTIDRIFSTGKEGEFLFTSGDRVFKRIAGSSSSVELPGIAPVVEDTGGNSPVSDAAPAATEKQGSILALVLSVAAIVVLGVLLTVIVRRSRKR
ncbi:MAG: hypothetical protein HGA38_02420 [Candidatus Moranbacteria bacterium]|nr:hypothetical protein [Candidatus Moranbacteria bacterium]